MNSRTFNLSIVSPHITHVVISDTSWIPILPSPKLHSTTLISAHIHHFEVHQLKLLILPIHTNYSVFILVSLVNIRETDILSSINIYTLSWIIRRGIDIQSTIYISTVKDQLLRINILNSTPMANPIEFICVGCSRNYFNQRGLNSHYDRLIKKSDTYTDKRHDEESMRTIRNARAGVTRRGVHSAEALKVIFHCLQY